MKEWKQLQAFTSFSFILLKMMHSPKKIVNEDMKMLMKSNVNCYVWFI
jgi:hypothetical protein